MPLQASAVAEVTREAIRATDGRIRPYIRRTPVIEVDAADFGLPPAQLTFKLELLQHAGSFKARGAFANLLTREVPPAGVVAASGGNHGVAVAFAAQKLGKPATIFVPSVASPEKMQRIRERGAKLVVVGDRYADALAASQKWQAETGAMPVHAYDQLETLLGQGTLAMEMQQQAPQIDSFLVSVGGGGLIGGVAAWYGNAIRVIGVEPETAPTLTCALRAGKPVDSPAGGIAADSLAPKQVGQLMFPIAQKFVNSVILVTDDEIRAAQNTLWQTLRVLAEPGGAAAFAALLSGKYQPREGERIAVLVCGGNLELKK
ncbi:MAG TPA: threonine/serine dehydratase [Candidatus Dormibacteraeota bacterium]|nr:threonine/serine dehydratase [Candidatus Dormibacteraeota bacterium]